jgi:hypothetical protein
MPGIQTYQQQSSLSGELNVRADSGAFGAAETQAASRIGAAMQDVGAAEQRIVRMQEERDARALLGQAVSQATLDWQTTLRDRQASALPGAPDFTPSLLKDFDEYSAKLVDNAPGPAARAFARQHMQALRTQLGMQAIAFEGQARVSLRMDQAQTSILNAGKVVQQDPAQYGAMAQLLRETMPDVGPATAKALNDKALHDLQQAAASSALENAPYDLRAKTEAALGTKGEKGATGVQWIDEAPADQVAAWNKQADARIKQIEAGKARDQDAAAKLAVDTVNKLRSFVTDGQLPSTNYQQEVRMLTKGTPWEQEAEGLIQAGVQGAGFGANTLPRQALILQEIEGKPTDPTVAAEIKHARSVFEAQSVAYKSDPWDAVARFQRQPAQASVPIQNGGQLLQIAQQRVPQMTMLETASGMPAPLLRPDEVPRAVSALQAMSPTARSETLGQVGAMLGSNDRVQALADQLEKGDRPLALTLKLGTDGTTAGRMVSELVQRGAQALKDKTVKSDDAALSGWRSEIAGLVRGTLGDTRAENDVIDAAYYVRAAMDQEGIAPEGFKLTATAANAVNMVAGQPVERNGVKTLLPRGMTESQFDTTLQRVWGDAKFLDQLKGSTPDGTLYLRGQPVPVDRFSANLLRYGLTRDGQGNYIPGSGGAFVTLDKAGTMPLRMSVQ